MWNATRQDFGKFKRQTKHSMLYRFLLLQMCLDVEHALKVPMLADIEDDAAEDGYQIVDDFLSENASAVSSITNTSGSSFSSGLIDKYFDISRTGGIRVMNDADCPVWVLTELLTFGDFARLYNFYYQRCGKPDKQLDMRIINPVRALRNACGHNNCMLFDLQEHMGKTKPGAPVSQFVAGIPTIGQKERQKKLSCRPLFEICCLLLAEQMYVTEDVRKHQMEKLRDFVHGRLQRHMDYFKDSQIITSAFDFLVKVVDGCA